MSGPSDIATTPEPPYFAVIFSSISSSDDVGYPSGSARGRSRQVVPQEQSADCKS